MNTPDVNGFQWRPNCQVIKWVTLFGAGILILALEQHLTATGLNVSVPLIGIAVLAGNISWSFGRVGSAILFASSFLFIVLGVWVLVESHMYWQAVAAVVVYFLALVFPPILRTLKGFSDLYKGGS